MELKIRIKEVKEETWNLTIEEECMFLFAKDKTPAYSMVVNRAKHKLEEIGLVDVCRLNEGGISVGVFRTETIRDATPEERMAWMYLNMVGEDRCPVCSVIGIGCESCILETCIASPRSRQKAKSILSNKEVILELV